MDEPRYIIIHGHFYQPPRESPWTGLISPEHGAAPFQNWNERILSECYTANAHAHTMRGSVVHVRNNYEQLNFDFGPTLAGWMQIHGKPAYRAITRATRSRQSGSAVTATRLRNRTITRFCRCYRRGIATFRSHGVSRISSCASGRPPARNVAAGMRCR